MSDPTPIPDHSMTASQYHGEETYDHGPWEARLNNTRSDFTGGYAAGVWIVDGAYLNADQWIQVLADLHCCTHSSFQMSYLDIFTEICNVTGDVLW